MILVSGASGRLGRRVIERLVERGAPDRVRALSRTPEKLADLASGGVDVKAADFDDPGSLGPAFEGGDVLLLISTDNIVDPGARIRQHEAAIGAARAAGVRHVVYTSAPAPVPENPVPITRDHAETERILRESGLAWTALRNNLYTDFLVESGAIAGGMLVGNAGAGRVPYVTRDDCAAAAVAVLLDPPAHANIAYEVTGPEALDRDELAAILTEVTGRTVANLNLEDDMFRGAVLELGVPPEIAEVVVTYGIATRDGWMGEPSTVVADLTGRPATPVRTFFEANRAALLAALEG